MKCHRRDETGVISQWWRLTGPAQSVQSPMTIEHNDMGLRMSKKMDRNIQGKGSREIKNNGCKSHYLFCTEEK